MDGQLQQSTYIDEDTDIYNNTFIRDGYEFTCWNTQADGKGTDIKPGDIKQFSNDTVLYAKWAFSYGFIDIEHDGNIDKDDTGDILSCVSKDNALIYTLKTLDINSKNIEILLETYICDNGNSDSKKKISLLGLRDEDYSTSNEDNDFELYIKEGKLVFKLTGTTSTAVIPTNKVIKIKLVKNSNTYTISVCANDDDSYVCYIAATSAKQLYNKHLYIGSGYTVTNTTITSEPKTVQLKYVSSKLWYPTCSVDKAYQALSATQLHLMKHKGYAGHGKYVYTYAYKTVVLANQYDTNYKTEYDVYDNLSGYVNLDQSFITINSTKYKMRIA